jgi:serine/threonine protein kinase
MPIGNALPSTACPTGEELYAFCVGRLSGAHLATIAEHLGTCTDCASTLDGLDDSADPTLAELKRPLWPEPLSEVECRRVAELIEHIRWQTTPPVGGAEGHGFTGLDATGPERPGQYVILDKIGGGGMGEVYKARHALMDQVVAIKVIHSQHFATPGIEQRFLREIRALSRLDHPNIVRAQYADRVGDTHFLVMEYVEGTDLARLVRERGPLPVAVACAYVRQAALGLQQANEHGLVHRDIKPSNLLAADPPLAPLGRGVAASPLAPLGRGVGGEGLVKILDLGLAAFHEEQPAAEGLTATGAVMGTADYMAPEQWEDTHAVDIRADLYSLGCTLYYLLAGSPPFSGPGCRSNVQKMKAHAEAPVPSIQERRPDVPDGLAAVLKRLLAKRPADRYATPAEVAEALRPFTTGAEQPPIQATPDPKPSPPAGPAQPVSNARRSVGARRRLRWAVGLAAALAAVLLIAVAVTRRFGVPSAPLPAPPDTGQPQAGPGPATPEAQLQITRFRVSHHRGDPSLELGDLGVSSLSARLEDDVRFHVQLNRPANCYLIAFRPDGKEQLCYPKDRVRKPIPPPQNEGFDYPVGPTSYFPLNDGVGLQVFVLLVSEKPLPPYDRWKAGTGAAPWQRVQADLYWHFDGQDFTSVSIPRGEEVKRQPLQPFQDLCNFFKDRPDIDAMQAVAFPVKPKE